LVVVVGAVEGEEVEVEVVVVVMLRPHPCYIVKISSMA